MRKKLTSALLAALLFPATWTYASYAVDEQVGERPYEMVWAGRDEEERTPVVDFESLDGWTVEVANAVASFERSREEQMYGQYVGKLTYRLGDGQDAPRVDVRPPAPIEIQDADIDTISLWVNGNNWGWTPDPNTPQVAISILFQNAEGQEVVVPTRNVDWNDWFLVYVKLNASVRKQLGTAPKFAGLRVTGGTNKEDRSLHFDSLCAFKEELKPLDITLRAKPGIELFEGQPLGINAGEGRLPFPTTEDTILPTSSEPNQRPMFHFYGDACDFVYETLNDSLVYYYKPSAGDWSDVSVSWNNGSRFYPCQGGGVKTLIGDNGQGESVEKAELVKFEQTDYGAKATWKLTSATTSAVVEYRFRLKDKSLIVDTIALGGNVACVSAGRLDKVDSPRVYTIPYYLYDYGKRPGVAVFKPSESEPTLFASAHIDWYRSGASYLQGANGVGVYEKEELTGPIGQKVKTKKTYRFATLNGGADYRAKTDGTRNDVYERFIFTISPRFEETLPSIANPKSPYRNVAGKGVWNAHGATTRDGDKRFWRDVWRRGMKHVIVTDHEVCWRDAGESFTFRTKPAPKKGGDEGWYDYSRFMQDELGFVYGPYNNFTDFAPVNEYWSPDMIGRNSDGSLQNAWFRCYAPKPTRAVEYCEKLTPINQEKFKFSCAYCDVHSSVPAWTRTDYDARVPGAGTFMSVFYPYGEIFLLQKQNWQGPTYSEGPHHCFYAGLTDGNYAQDQPYNLFKNQWLLDFDLLKIHEQEVDFGMGNLGMFAPGYRPKTTEEGVALVDRFLAATIAFGHSGYLALDYGIYHATQSYFMIQQIAARYTQTSVDSIRYIDAEGKLLDTSAALAADAVKRNQVCVKYKDGTVVVANGSNTETLRVDLDGQTIVLPPNGYQAYSTDGVVVESKLSSRGKRYDYCASPEYIYVDGRGNAVQCELACGEGQGVCLILGDGKYEIVPTYNAEIGFKIADDDEELTAVAVAYDGKELGPATLRRSRGYVYVMPQDGAFSYILTKTGAKTPANVVSSDRLEVTPGETIAVKRGDAEQTLNIPVDAALGRYWAEVDGAFIDFYVVRPLEEEVSFDPKTNMLSIALTSNAPNVNVAHTFVDAGSTSQGVADLANAGDRIDLKFKVSEPIAEGEDAKTFSYETTLSNGVKTKTEQTLVWNVALQYVRFEDRAFDDSVLEAQDGPVSLTPLVQLREKQVSQNFGETNATKFFNNETCGGVTKRAWFLHPPYNGGQGRTILRYDLDVPNEPSTFRMSCGRRDGSDRGDGILFQIAIAEFNAVGELLPETEKVLAETTVVEFQWQDVEADLSAYAGKKISLLVVSDCGPNNDTSGDWGCVADLRLESSEKTLVRELK